MPIINSKEITNDEQSPANRLNNFPIDSEHTTYW